MSASGLDTTTRTPEQAKADRDRKDRSGWYAGHYPTGEYVIWGLDGRLVCKCRSEADRDFILDCVRKAVTS